MEVLVKHNRRIESTIAAARDYGVHIVYRIGSASSWMTHTGDRPETALEEMMPRFLQPDF